MRLRLFATTIIVSAVLSCADSKEPTRPVFYGFDWLVREVTISPTIAVVFLGDSLAFGAVVNTHPSITDRSVRWTSSSPAVAIDSRGIATAIQLGPTTITAASSADGSVRAEATVTVIARPVPQPTSENR